MASLKEVKGRIASVNNTRKITSAMKMVASAKLHKAQAAIESMLPYERRLHHILTDFMSNCTEVTSPFIVKREVKKVAVVVFASNTSLCGGFNANVIRHLVDLLAEYKPLAKVEELEEQNYNMIDNVLNNGAEKKEQEQTKGRISIKEKLAEKKAVIEQRDRAEHTSPEKETEKKSQREM
jgi:F0F1-type ATP synthase gamma subunit